MRGLIFDVILAAALIEGVRFYGYKRYEAGKHDGRLEAKLEEIESIKKKEISTNGNI